MKPLTKMSFILSAMFLTLLCGVARADDTASGRKGDNSVPPFILEDANGNKYDLSAMKGECVLLLFGPNNLKNENEKWAQAFKDLYGKRADIKVFMIADMRGIPFFITTDFIKEQIRKEQPVFPLLLDWKQKVNILYGIDLGTLGIVAIGPDGKIVLRHKSSGFDPSELKLVLAALESALPLAQSKGN